MSHQIKLNSGTQNHQIPLHMHTYIHTKLMKIEELMEPHTPDSSDEKTVVPFRSEDHRAMPLPIDPPIVEKKGGSNGCESFSSSGYLDKDIEMAKVETEKRMALIKAWEANEKARAENRASKKITMVESWEERKKATLEFQLKKLEEKLEKAKAEYRERKENKVAELRKAAEEKKAEIEAQCGRNVVEIVGKADRYRASGRVPKKIIRCFSSISC